jgi:peptidoglycan/LPS O-acetylase OafA/YrhL
VLIPALILTQLLDRIGTGVNGASGIYSGAEGYHTVVPLGGAVQFLGIPETLGNLLFVQSLWVPTLGTNTPLWSLAYELWFYILFPALLLACSSRQPLKRRVIAAVVVVLVSLVAGPKVMLLFPIWVAGAMIAWKKDAITRAFSDARKSAFYAARLITPGLTFAVAAASSYLNERLPGADYIVGFAALMMIAAYAGDVRGPGTPLYRSSQAAHWSYSLYAYHLPIVALIVSFMVPAADQRWQVSPGTVSLGLLVAVIAFLAAYAMSLITEQRKDAALGLVRRVSALGGQSPKKVERPLKADIN